MRKMLISYCLLLPMGILLGTSCGREKPSSLSLEQQGEVVPRDFENRVLGCKIPNRETTVKTFSTGSLLGKTVNYQSSGDVNYQDPSWSSKVSGDWNAFRGKIPQSVKMVAIDIRYINNRPHYAYFSNGTQLSINQNWSSTKVIAQLGALHRIRLLSGGKIGTQSIINDFNLGSVPFLTHSFRLHDTSSNASGGLFKHLMGVEQVHSGKFNPTAFVRGWLGQQRDLFNGFYGYSRYDDYYSIRPKDGGEGVYLDTSARATTPNLLSPLTMAEFWKRLGTNFDDEMLLPKGRLYDGVGETYAYVGQGQNPYVGSSSDTWQTTITPDDVADLLYGQEGNGIIDGAMSDIGIDYRFTNAFGGSARLDSATDGRWRIFGKTGSGEGNSAYGVYVCLPEYLGGRAFAAFFLGTAPSGTSKVRNAIRQVIAALAPGLNQGNPQPGLDPDEDVISPPKVPAPIQCPIGYGKELVGSLGGSICTDGVNAWGPFTRSMIARCIAQGGGEAACNSDRWARGFAINLRGTNLCPVGARFDFVTRYCIERVEGQDNAFGPFPQPLIDECILRGGGQACYSSRWDRSLLIRIIDSLN